jgi:hypothetical protein
MSEITYFEVMPFDYADGHEKYLDLYGMAQRKSAGARDRLEIIESDACLLPKRGPN